MNKTLHLLLSREPESIEVEEEEDGLADLRWKYIDDHLICDVEGFRLSASGITGHDGTVWAQSSTFPLFKPEEATAILNDLTHTGSLAPTGLFLCVTGYGDSKANLGLS